MGWALERDDAGEQRLALQILASSGSMGGYAYLGLGTLAVRAVDAAAAAPPELRVPVLTLAAYSEWNEGRAERARALVQDALRDGVVTATLNPFAPYVGAVVFEMDAGNVARAMEIAREARAMVDTVDDPYAQAACLSGIGTFEAMAGLFDDARADTERALALARASRNVEAIATALQSTAWALHRDDPAAALAAADESMDLYREFDLNSGGVTSVLAFSGGLRARLGDDAGALGLFHDAVVVARDQGVRPQLAATLDWALSPLFRVGAPEVSATFLGALLDGALVGVGDWPGIAASRSKALERARSVLGDQVDGHLARGAAMSYDELAEYAIRHLGGGA